MGLTLRNPIVASASPLSRTVGGIEQMALAGAGAVVLYSLFEEQIEHEQALFHHYLEMASESHAEALRYFPDAPGYSADPDDYLMLISRAKRAVDIPIIASLNGTTPGGWVKYAKQIQSAGADGLELNVYFIPANAEVAGADVENRYYEILSQVKDEVTLPVAMKISPFVSSLPYFARELSSRGANALVLFNRFYQPDIDLDRLEVTPHLRLSNSDELRMPLRWVSLLHGRVKSDLAISTGVHTHKDVLKGLMVGAKVTMMASALLHHGISHINGVLADLTEWLETREYESVKQMQGSMSYSNLSNPENVLRTNYMQVLDSWGKVNARWY
jgi:dihydroorotate dehydrogenase (fumarate)